VLRLKAAPATVRAIAVRTASARNGFLGMGLLSV
jgi:hypothetical protein